MSLQFSNEVLKGTYLIEVFGTFICSVLKICTPTKMERFVKAVNIFQVLTVFTKHSILHVWEGFELWFSDYDSVCFVDKRFKDGKDILSLDVLSLRQV